MIKITDAAKDMLTPILADHPGKYLRVVVQGIGWGGPRLGMALDAPQEDEEVFKVDNLEILINEDAKPYASSNVLDYIKTVEGEGFILQPESGQCCW